MRTRGLEVKLMLYLIVVLSFLWASVGSQLIFPYGALNHDEPVYLLQAQALLEGKLAIKKTIFSSFFKTWFQAERSGFLLFKYTPIHAALLAIGQLLFGNFHISLGLIAGLTTLFSYLFFFEVTSSKRVSLLASVYLFLSPLFLVQSLTFLSYTSCLMLQLCFGFLFLKSMRLQSIPLMILSGIVCGIAFFARPYDTLQFSAALGLAFLFKSRSDPFKNIRNCLFVLFGFIPICLLIFWFNSSFMGNPFQFPFKQDNLDTFGFGLKRFTESSGFFNYDLTLATSTLLSTLTQFHKWIFGGLPFLILFLVYLPRIKTWKHLSLISLLLIVPLGYFFWWGPILFKMFPTLGPYYHILLLVPISLFTAQMTFYLGTRRIVFIALVLIGASISSFYTAQSLIGSYEYTRQSQRIYEPLKHANLNQSLIFLPGLIGPFLLHPFAVLSNTPEPSGPTIFALDQGRKNFHLIDYYKDRSLYRFDYYGEFDSNARYPTTQLVPLKVIKSKSFQFNVSLTNISNRPYMDIVLMNGKEQRAYTLDRRSKKGKKYKIEWKIAPEKETLTLPLKNKTLITLNGISENSPLIISVCLGVLPNCKDSLVYQYKLYFRKTRTGEIEMIYPPETWFNPRILGGEPQERWRNQNIEGILSLQLKKSISNIG
jgi:4-amino-4-deoxy-L-arabinose transferase-like glycosyltransferase